ncbi:TlpA family protein disulfide reductase [Winogradskyella aurantia]|uniref:Thioredoxin domain-containing protein n=1 Tax=Winogradskyella aurantia TaxID=1915063 RepID=A0A265UTK1_9FLAO|nr:TlpA disulfide reductase family protein [Winogradskyella aurantia]OZV68626.1 hypothetical protein CA834_09170 [Winogradskyella aurantia]
MKNQEVTMNKLISLVAILLFFSCETEKTIDYAIISGKLENSNVKSVKLIGFELEKEISINDVDNSFSDTLYLDGPAYFDLQFGRTYATIYLKNGDELNITADTEDFDKTIRYSGDGSKKNQYLTAKSFDEKKLRPPMPELYSLDEQAFKNILKDIELSHLKLLEDASIMDTDFIALEKDNLKYESFLFMNDYEAAHRYFSNQPEFKVSSSFFPEDFKSMTFDNEAIYSKTNIYRSLARNALLKNIYQKLGDNPELATVNALEILEDIKIPALKNDILKSLQGTLISPTTANLDSFFDYFIANTASEEDKATLVNQYENAKRLMKGQPSPQFVNYENHKGGETSLSDLRGKYVYIDVWATWCGPCIKEIPSLKEVEKKYHNKNIEFVSTSIDQSKDHDTWVQMVTDKNLGGVQLLADNAGQSKFVQDYDIQGIPHFVLIDPEGNIISADAPRPSDPRLIELFEKLDI